MSELNFSAALVPELPKPASIGPAGIGGRVPGSGVASGRSPPNPFAALLSGVLQGTQPLARPTDPLAPGSAPLTVDLAADLAAELPAELLAAAPADPARLLALPAATGPPAPVPDASTAPASGSLYGNVLPPTGKTLPPGVPGDIVAKTVPATTAPESNDVPSPAAPRPGVSLADLAYSRQLADAPGLATASPPDGARSAAAMAFAGRALASSRTIPVESLGPAQDLTLDLVANLAVGADAAPVSAQADGLNLPPPVADLWRTTLIPGAGAHLAGQKLAAFSAGDDRSATLSGSASPGAPGASGIGSAELLSRLGSTTLPGLQPLGDAGAFSAGLADRLLMLGGPGAHSARLKLYPEHLGELKVDIRIDDGSAEVWFSTTTAQAREAIEGSLPRLRELFADQGIQLTRAHVDAGGGQTGNSGFGQERRMPGGAGAWSDVPAWQPGRTGAGAGPAGRTAAGISARLLDVWA